MRNFYTDNKALDSLLNHPDMQRIIALREGDFQESASCDYAPRNNEEALADYREVMTVLGQICGETISANARDVDQEGPHLEVGRVVYAPGTQANHRRLQEAGLYGMTLDRRYGGLNFPTTLFTMASEMIARADGGFACLWALQNCAETIAAFGTEEQQAKYLPHVVAGATCSMDLTEPEAGSDLQSAALRATWDEQRATWLLNGVKRFITNGDADLKLVLARTEADTTDARGLSLFVVDRTQGGITVRRLEKKLGIRGTATCELVFTDTPAELIGTRRMGLIRYVLALMNAARLGVGAQAVGIAEAALREAKQYAAQRLQFGRPIICTAAVSEMITAMRTKLDALRALLYETARQVDLAQGYGRKLAREGLNNEERQAMKRAQQLADMYTPLVKLMAGEECNRMLYDAMQIFGGSGYMQDFPIERLYRDARVVTIYEGTSQMQVVAATRYLTDGTLCRQLHALAQQVGDDPHNAAYGARLDQLTERLEAMINTVNRSGEEIMRYHARRLVECGAMLLMGYLMPLSAQEEQEHYRLQLFETMIAACIAAHETTIGQLNTETIAALRQSEEERAGYAERG